MRTGAAFLMSVFWVLVPVDCPGQQPLPKQSTVSPAAPVQPQSNSEQHQQKVLEHLRHALEHLEAAGLPQQARQLRVYVRDIKQVMRSVRKIRPPEQILLQVQFIEAASETVHALRLALEPDLSNADATAGAPVLFFNDSKIAAGMLERLRHDKQAQILAQPTLVFHESDRAKFHSGGEFPILIPDAKGDLRPEYRPFGVMVTARGTITKPGTIHLELEAEISERDFGNAVTVRGLLIPGLTTRRIRTQVDVPSGDVVLVGGLISTREVNCQADEAVSADSAAGDSKPSNDEPAAEQPEPSERQATLEKPDCSRSSQLLIFVRAELVE